MRRNLLLGALFALVTAACSDSTGPNGQIVSLSFNAGAPAASLSPAAGISLAPISDGANTLDLTSVEIVLREIELKRVETTDCDTAVDPDACEEFALGPMLFDLPLDGSTSQEISVQVEPGSYDELEFEIHKVSGDDAADLDFLTANPTFDGVSIRAQGTFNGNPFVYETDLDVEQEHDLVPAITIADGVGATNVTIFIDVSAWFRDQLGNLVDPATANKGGENESIVKSNITQSIDAEEDTQ